MPATANDPGTLAGPILIDIDEMTWKEHVDRAERWLGHVAMVQAEFRTLAEATAAQFYEPHLREQLTKVAEAAREHEKRVAEMYRVLGRTPEAEDAFQTTFLILVQKAAALSSPGQVAGWLHGVALRVARRVRDARGRRRQRFRQRRGRLGR